MKIKRYDQLARQLAAEIPRKAWMAVGLSLAMGGWIVWRQLAGEPVPAASTNAPGLLSAPPSIVDPARPLRVVEDAQGRPQLPGQATLAAYAEDPNDPNVAARAKKKGGQSTPEPIVSRQINLTQYNGRTLFAAFDPSLRQHMRVQQDNAQDFAFSILLAPEARVDVSGTGQQVLLSGKPAVVEAWSNVIAALDAARPTEQEKTHIVAATRKSLPPVRKALTAIAGDPNTNEGAPARRQLVAFQQPGEANNQPAQDANPENPLRQNAPAANFNQAGENEEENGPPENGPLAAPNQPNLVQAAPAEPNGGVLGQVRVEFLEGLDVIVLRGRPADVDRVVQIINEIEQLTAETQPRIEVWALQHVASEQLAFLLQPLYSQVLVARTGGVSITPLVKPNSLLLIGRDESVAAVLDLVARLDVPVEPSTQFRVFRLKHAAALEVKVTVDEFYANRAGLGTRALVTADDRSNSLIVNASPRDLEEVATLLAKLDTPTSAAINELRVYQLRSALAIELATVLNEAIAMQTGAQRGGVAGQQLPLPQPPQAGGAPGAGQQARVQQARTLMLNFLTIDATGGTQQFRSGILRDVKITADARANALVVSAPAASLGLIGALIEALDQLPAAESQIKVFTIANSDASSLVEMLQALFGSEAAGGARNLGNLAFGGAGGQDNLVRLRFSVDQRTNSIVASGTSTDLTVVEALLLRLDESDIRQRKSVVYRLKNAPALDVSNAVNELLRSERQVQQVSPGLISPFEQIEREVVVVPEPVSNSLIVSATPRYFEEIRKIVEQLRRTTSDGDDPGADWRSDPQRHRRVWRRVRLSRLAAVRSQLDRRYRHHEHDETTTTPGGAVQTVQAETIQAATITPGFNFNNLPLGNSASDKSLSTRENLAAQGLSNFSLGRVNGELGYGGFVFSAGNESISLLLRALQESRRLEVLSRPQIMTLDNQPAFIQVGQRVPRITGTTINQTGQVNNIQLENVGLILGVTPRISPDGLVVMEIDAEKSEVGPDSEGIPISISANGDVIRSPRVNISTAQTTVSALSGQTVVLGGLITRSTLEVSRRLPLVADIPLIGWLFRYDSQTVRRTELLIVMTPRIVRNEMDAEEIKRVESSRMSWVLSDVIDLHGQAGLLSRKSDWCDAGIEEYYPGQDFRPEYFPPAGVPASGAGPMSPAHNPALRPIPHQQSVLTNPPSQTHSGPTPQAMYRPKPAPPRGDYPVPSNGSAALPGPTPATGYPVAPISYEQGGQEPSTMPARLPEIR